MLQSHTDMQPVRRPAVATGLILTIIIVQENIYLLPWPAWCRRAFYFHRPHDKLYL